MHVGAAADRPGGIAGLAPAIPNWTRTGLHGGSKWQPHDCAFSLTRRKSKRTSGTPSIPIRLSDLYPLLAQAYRDNYVWLRDFEEDRLMVSNDLFEVIRAFSNCRPSA